jgi:TRAP-type C4-dicarboxylate transport system permease large subunit
LSPVCASSKISSQMPITIVQDQFEAFGQATLLCIHVFALIAGMFIAVVSNSLMLAPILLALATEVGISRIDFDILTYVMSTWATPHRLIAVDTTRTQPTSEC